MKNINEVVRKSQLINQKDRSTWVELYYSFETDSVYTKAGEKRYHVANLINPHTRQDVIEAVEEWKRM